MIEAEWLGGPEDGKVVALPDDTHEVRTAVMPDFNWVRENDSPSEVDVQVLVHPVYQRWGRHWILWTPARP